MLNESVLEMENEAAEDTCPHTLDGQRTRPPSSMKPVNRIHRGKRMRERVGWRLGWSVAVAQAQSGLSTGKEGFCFKQKRLPAICKATKIVFRPPTTQAVAFDSRISHRKTDACS